MTVAGLVEPPRATVDASGVLRAELPAYAQPLVKPARDKSLRGGRGSAKSHTLAQIAVLRMANLLPDYPPGPVRIASARAFEVSIKESVKIVVEGYIQAYGLEDEFDVRERWIDNTRTGSHMMFPGVTKKVSSFLGMEALDVFWMEQAESLGDEMILVDPTLRKDGAEAWYSWNPSTRTSWTWKRFVSNPQPGDVSILANYRDNPWWTEQLEARRLYWMEAEPSLYPWMYLGQPNDGDAQSRVLPYESLLLCVKAFEAGLMGDLPPLVDVGLDVAEGGRDKCALVIRQGPAVLLVEEWPGVTGDLSIAANKARDMSIDYDPARCYYDASSPMRTDLLRAGFVGVRPVNFGGEVQGPDVLYEPRRPNREVFSARNIQMADALRLRANRTRRLLNGDKRIDPNTCLFISPEVANLEMFMADCADPIRRVNPTSGRWELDKRGGDENAKSPDSFDALCLSFARDTDQRGLRARL